MSTRDSLPGLPPEAQQLLAREREIQDARVRDFEPSAELEARVLERVLNTVGAPPAPSAPAQAGAAPGVVVTAAKLPVVGLIAVGALISAGLWWHAIQPTPDVTAPVTPVAPSTPPIPEPVPEVDVVETPPATPPPAPPRPAPTTRARPRPEPSPAPVKPEAAPAPAPSGDNTPVEVAPREELPVSPPAPERNMVQERGLLEQARQSLSRGRTTEALEILRRHGQEFPAGELAEERDALVIMCLHALGRAEEAQSAFTQFRETYPRSLMIPGLDAALGSR
ncbi:MAG: hypothetical protein AB2A00_17165 [Myxococcota bacterium]